MTGMTMDDDRSHRFSFWNQAARWSTCSFPRARAWV